MLKLSAKHHYRRPSYCLTNVLTLNYLITWNTVLKNVKILKTTLLIIHNSFVRVESVEILMCQAQGDAPYTMSKIENNDHFYQLKKNH